MSYRNAVHILSSKYFKLNFNIIHSSAPKFHKWALPFRCSDKNVVCTFLTSPYELYAYALRPSSSDRRSNSRWRVQIVKLLMSFSSAQSYFRSLRSKCSPLVNLSAGQSKAWHSHASEFEPHNLRPSVCRLPNISVTFVRIKQLFLTYFYIFCW
jgi:hypothetical protein